MFHKGKLIVFLSSTLVVLYGVSAAFYGKVVAGDEAYKELSVFIDALKKINDDYVQAPDLSRVQEGALRGLIESLDPYSCFLSREQAEAIDKRKTTGKAGIGVVLSKRTELICVVALARGSGAEEAGMRPGDYIVVIDGTGVEDVSIPEVESLLRGPEGSRVKVTVFRNSRSKPVELDVVRTSSEGSSAVNSRILDGGVGLLEVASLAGPALEAARVKLRTLVSAGVLKVVLDLRDCADGRTGDGAALANLFLSGGVLSYSQNRAGGRVDELRAKPEELVTDLPLVVLINGSTAGGAEVAAGALKDSRRATLVGERSFGIGSAQRTFELRSGGVLILSIAKVFTPGGKMIQDENPRQAGIKPDVQAPDDDRHQDLLVESYFDEADDAAKYRTLRDKVAKEQLDRALEALSRIPAKKAA